ncbi:hypothetical protein Hanom_Chr09g00864421 [Helianthus anomalus]
MLLNYTPNKVKLVLNSTVGLSRIIYIYIKPIKCNHLPNRYPPLDLAEMKSEPFKLTKITALVAVPRSYGWFLYVVVTSTFYCPLSSQLWWLPSKLVLYPSGGRAYLW